MKKQNLRIREINSKGITLVALVISIIVLLILATVTIQTLTGDNGLLQKATTAKEENEKAKELELIKLAVASAKLAGEGKLTTTNLKSELKINLNDNEIDNNFKPISNYWTYKEYKIDNNGNVERLLLPAEYQQVEYIESTGQQYIDTGYKSNNTTIIETDMQITDGIWIFGARTAVKTQDSFALALDPDRYAIRIGTNNYNDVMTTTTRKRTKIYLSNSKLKLDSNDAKVFLENVTKGVYNIFICALNQGGNASDKLFVGRVYSFKIWDNGVLTKDYIPAKSTITNKVGLYDTVEGKFYTNQGTGEFIAGPDV